MLGWCKHPASAGVCYQSSVVVGCKSVLVEHPPLPVPSGASGLLWGDPRGSFRGKLPGSLHDHSWHLSMTTPDITHAHWHHYCFSMKVIILGGVFRVLTGPEWRKKIVLLPRHLLHKALTNSCSRRKSSLILRWEQRCLKTIFKGTDYSWGKSIIESP